MMKKILVLVGFLVLLWGCASEQRVADLEQKVAQLSKQKAGDTMLLAEQAGARRFWWKNGLTGGATSDLNGIAAASLTDGDAAIVAVKSGEATTLYFYIYDSDSTTDSNSPLVIEPNPLLGGEEAGAWFLATLQVIGITGNAADGYRYYNATNSAAPAWTPAEGDCFWKQNEDDFCCYDAAAATWLCHSFD